MIMPSSFKNINDMLDGGYEEGLPTAVFGRPESGKSIFLNQEACYICSIKPNSAALMIDTEGGNLAMLRQWLPMYEKRFNHKYSLVEAILTSHEKTKKKPKEKLDTAVTDMPEDKDEEEPKEVFSLSFSPPSWENTPLFVVNLRTLKKFLAFFGYDTTLRISDKGKMDLRFLGESKNFCAEMFEEHNISTIVIDSLSNPLSIFSGGLLNFPGRANALKLIFPALQDIADKYSPIMLMSHHATFDPQNPYDRPEMFGGKWVYHNTKVSLYFKETQSKKAEHLGLRTVYLTRYFDKPRFSVFKKLRLTDEGFIDEGLTNVVADDAPAEEN